MSKLHNQVISFKDLKKVLPPRIMYTDPDDREKVNEILDESEPILFLPTYLQESTIQDKKYDKAKYKIILNGIFTDGRRVNVLLDGIMPYFEVRIPDNVSGGIKVGRGSHAEYLTQAEYITRVRNLLARDKQTTPEKTSTIYGKPFKYYQLKENKFLRFYYWKTKTRKLAIKLVRDSGYETAHDDISCYYRVVCRDYLTSMSTWVTLTNYVEHNVKCLKSKNSINTYRLDISNYHRYTGEITPLLLKDKTLSMTWDIETWSPDHSVPLPSSSNHKMFCIGITFQWVNEEKSFLKLVLVDYPRSASVVKSKSKSNANHPDGFLTVICGSEVNVIKAFGTVFEKMRPEFIIGFNDSEYDWNWLINRAAETRGLVSRLANNLDSAVPWRAYSDDAVMQFNYKKEKVKIESSTYAEGQTLMMNGYIPIDARTVFRRLYPTAEASNLKWFLAENKLGGKEDMPYKVMFTIYGKMRDIALSKYVSFNPGVDIDFTFEENTPTELIAEYTELKQKLCEVNNYCVVDALRCHDLCKIRSVIMDHREMSGISYTSVFDAFYRANGMKVRNLTIATGQDPDLPFGIRFTNITSQVTTEGKYPGAFVFPPKKGLQTSKLTFLERIRKAKMTKESKRKAMQDWLETTTEEVKMFQDIVQEYGAAIVDADIIESIESTRGKLPKKFIDFLSEHMGRPITGLDFSSLYPSLMCAYNFSPEYCILDKKFAKQIHASGQKLIKVDFDFSGSRRKAWFVWHNNNLDPTKEEFQFGVYPYILHKLFNQRKTIKKKMLAYKEELEEMEAKSNSYLVKHANHYTDTKFLFNYLNSKQMALKVFMNTFYGEAGNKLSAFFVVEVAGGITMAGQRNIKMSQAFVEDLGHKVYYGDSVTGETPVLIGRNGVNTFMSIDSIAHTYKPAPQGKEVADVNGIFVWSDDGFVKINRIIRHKTTKQLYRVSTSTGVVDVTEDHSMLTDNGVPITPGNLSVGVKLMHRQLPMEYKCDSKIDSITAARYGYNMGYPKRLDPASHSMCFRNGIAIVPDCILGGSHEVRLAFFTGFSNRRCQTGDVKKFKLSYGINAATFCWLFRLLGYKFIIDKMVVTVYTKTKPASGNLSSSNLSSSNQVISIEKLPLTVNYVYDLETVNHHFAAGVGNLIVHNTDSIYLAVDDSEFDQIDRQYYSGAMTKLDYWTKLVEITFDVIKPLNKLVNEMFLNDNGTKFLSMAYEEALFPVAFTAKKKYFGIPHENFANFNPKKLFVKGLEVKKRGVSDLLKKIFNELMWTSCVDRDNLYTPLELSLTKIDDIYNNREWKLADFIQTDVFRPNKNNIKIHRFVNRMLLRGIKVPSNDRFKYVIVKKYPYRYDDRGRKVNLGIGDKMEFVETAIDEKLEVDLDHYMNGSVNGQLARLVVYHEMFKVDPIDNTAEELKVAEDRMFKNATKFIKAYSRQYYSSYNTFGSAYQKVFRTANKLVGDYIKTHDTLTHQLVTANVPDEGFEEWFIESVDKRAIKLSNTFGQEFLASELAKITSEHKKAGDKFTADEKKELSIKHEDKLQSMQRIYYGVRKSIMTIRTTAFRTTMSILRRQVREHIASFRRVFSKYQGSVNDISRVLKTHMNIDDKLFDACDTEIKYKFDDFGEIDADVMTKLDEQAKASANELLKNKDMRKIINDMKRVYKDILAAHLVYRRTQSIVDALKIRRNRMTNAVMRPDDDVIDAIIAADIQNVIASGMLGNLKII